MFNWLKSVWTWVKDKWNKFGAWVASKAPGWKTQIVAAIGWGSMSLATLQEMVTGFPLDQFITAKTIAITTGTLFVLVTIFKHLSNKYST